MTTLWRTRNSFFSPLDAAKAMGYNKKKFRQGLKAIKKILGMIYRENGEIKFSIRKPIKNIDKLPLPSWDLVPMELYQPAPSCYRKLPSIAIITSRGCPYQCTYCKKFFHETEESILINYVETGKVKMLFKDFIVVNEDSLNAASAAHCANDQKMFWQYHSTLYNNWDGEGTGWASPEQLHQFAFTLGLDMNEFSECMSNSKWKDFVLSSHADGRTLGVDATPTFFIIDENNEVLKIVGSQRYDV